MINEIAGHRSVRKYKTTPIPEDVMTEILTAGTRASNTGNMQLYSIVVSTSPEIREKLAPLHFNQPMMKQAPAVVTFCADINRFNLWCRQRGAEPAYDNFLWFASALVDATLASQNVALEAKAHGLGICYLGTVMYNAEKIVEALELPHGVVPVAAFCMGYPDGEAPMTDRLPLEAVVHRDTYKDYTPQDIDRIWAEREASEETQGLLRVNDLPNLAQIFTERRYVREDNLRISRYYFDVLRRQGFFNQ